MQAARRDCERGMELWFNTKAIGWEWDAIFVVPFNPNESGWFLASDNSPPEQDGFSWLREVSSTPLELVGEPTGSEFGISGNVENFTAMYLLTIYGDPRTEIELRKGAQVVEEPEEPPAEEEQPDEEEPPAEEEPWEFELPPVQFPPFLTPLHIIILPSGNFHNLGWGRLAGGVPHPNGDLLVKWAKTQMIYHGDGSVTTLEEGTETLTGEDAAAFRSYIELIGQKVPIEFA